MKRAIHWSVPGAALRAVATLLVTAGLMLVRDATAADRRPAPEQIVAITFDYSSDSLLLVTRRSLYRRVATTDSWRFVDLPRGKYPGNISSIAVSAQPPYTLYISGTTRTLLRSLDGGATWKGSVSGLPRSAITAISAHADRGSYAYAYVKTKGVYRSADHGATWRMMDKGPGPGFDHVVHTNMPGSMESGWLFAATPGGLFRAMDCFCGWHTTGAGDAGVHAVAFNRVRPEQVFVGSTTGVARSDDGGETFVPLPNAPVAVVSMVAAPLGRLYAATRDKVFLSVDSGHTWRAIDG